MTSDSDVIDEESRSTLLARRKRQTAQAKMIGLFIAGNLLAPPAVRWLTQYMEHHRGTRLVGKAMHLLGLPALQFATYYYGTVKPYFQLIDLHEPL